MGTQLGEAYVPIRATLDKLDGDLAQARGKVEGAMGKIGSLAGGAGRAVQTLGKVALGGLGILTGAAAAAGAGLASLAANAEPLLGLQQGFATVTGRIGTSAQSMLSSLQDASGGLITNRDLMASFNQAASLVSDDFAKKLPDAMGLVRRASQATGQDMGFLFQSLVTGVGRVSPMILDNLGIQIQLAAVTERAAEMFGKQASELSKTEQQAALTEIVMEKLGQAYGDMPDVTPTFAKIGTTIANLKDEIGLKLLPVLSPLIEKVLNLAEKALPVLMDILDKDILPVLMDVSDAFGTFLGYLMDGEDPLEAISQLIYDLGTALGLSDETASGLSETFSNVIETIQGAITTVMEFLQPIIEAITNFVSWKDVLIALGIAIAAVVIPAVISLLASLLPIIIIGAALIGLVALVRHAWEENWGGIQEKVASVVNWFKTVLMPFIVDTVYPWLKEKLTQALQILSNFWTDILKPAIEAVWSWMSTVLIPFLQNTVYPWLKENIPAALQILSDFWNNVLLPAIDAVWSFISTYLIPIFVEIKEIVGILFPLAITALQGAWENVLLPALEKVGDFVKTYITPALTWLMDHVIKPLTSAIGTGLKNALDWVLGKLRKLKDMLSNLKLPKWLTPGSPTPFEMGLRGINEALEEMNRLSSQVEVFNPPRFNVGNLMPVMEMGGMAGAQMGSSRNSLTLFGDMIFPNVTDRDSFLEEMSELMI